MFLFAMNSYSTGGILNHRITREHVVRSHPASVDLPHRDRWIDIENYRHLIDATDDPLFIPFDTVHATLLMKHSSHNTRRQIAENVEVNRCGTGLNYMY